MAAILNEEPPELTSVNPALPPALERIVRHCLEKDRDERFASARDLAFDLQSISDSGTQRGTSASARRWGGRWPWALLLWTVAVSAVSVWFGRSHAAAPSGYRPLTFRRGSVTSARFSPDGTYFFYSAAWSGGPARVYSTRLEVPGDEDLGLDGDLVAVAPGDLFVLRPDQVLVRANLAGQGAREVADGVSAADVSADGTRIVVVRPVASKGDHLESPPGTVIYETTGEISDVQDLSPGRSHRAPGIAPGRDLPGPSRRAGPRGTAAHAHVVGHQPRPRLVARRHGDPVLQLRRGALHASSRIPLRA